MLAFYLPIYLGFLFGSLKGLDMWLRKDVSVLGSPLLKVLES